MPKATFLITAYAVLRPDGQWSLMLINKDYDNPHKVRVNFHDDDAKQDRFFVGPVTMITFGKAQYRWHSGLRDGYADPGGPPAEPHCRRMSKATNCRLRP